MFDPHCPLGRLFYVLLVVLMALPSSQAQSPGTTTISDIIYRADGTPAGGTLLIYWPLFSTAAGQAVAAGTKSVTLATGGSLSLALVPNVGATPANTFYTVIYQLNDGTVKTEFWVVPISSPTTIAAMRTTPGSASSAASLATQQYVNAALAGKANDAAVVHLSGSETISGAKQFSVPPSVPTPSNSTDVVNKAYVDTSVTNSGSGSFVHKAGGAMTGPLLLPGDPTAPNQASDRHYVDSGLAAKADLISGVVPAAELASGSAGNSVCLHGGPVERCRMGTGQRPQPSGPVLHPKFGLTTADESAELFSAAI
jgi:hypothetical protein